MIVNLASGTYRLFFEHEDVPRAERYNGHNRPKRANVRVKATVNEGTAAKPKIVKIKELVTVRTVCKFDQSIGKDSADKHVWQNVADAVVYQNHQDAPARRTGSLRAFSKLMRQPTFRTFTREERAQIAQEFIASRPRRKNEKDLRKEIVSLQAKVARYEELIDVTRLNSQEYIDYLHNAKLAGALLNGLVIK